MRDRELAERQAKKKDDKERMEREQRLEEETKERDLDELEKLVLEQASRAGFGLPDLMTGRPLLSSAFKIPDPTGAPSIPLETRRGDAASSDPSVSATATASDDLTFTTALFSTVTITPAQNNVSALFFDASDSASFGTTNWATASSVDTTSPASSTSIYSRNIPPRSDSSESIYAFIIRRLNALEGNSTLVARYIEEQSRAIRLSLGRVEKRWDEWKSEREDEDRGRWDQEVNISSNGLLVC